jgi:hypothetical protein
MVVQCDNLIYTPINALTFRITGNTECLKPVKKNGVIVALEGPNDLNITLGLTVPIKKTKYKINIIEQVRNSNSKLVYDISIAKRTKATTFVMPMLPGTRKLYFWSTFFVNCFIATPEDKDCIALLFRWSADTRYIKFEKILKEVKYFRRRYDPSPNYVMFVFDIPKGFRREYRAFMLGKYSKFSREYKLDILDFHNADINDEVGQIIFKSDKRRELLEKRLNADLPKESELLSIIDIEAETYNPDIYKLKKLL